MLRAPTYHPACPLTLASHAAAAVAVAVAAAAAAAAAAVRCLAMVWLLAPTQPAVTPAPPHWHLEGAQVRTAQRFFFGYLGGRNPIGWPHTIHLGEPNCRGSEALPHQYNTPHTQYQGVLGYPCRLTVLSLLDTCAADGSSTAKAV
jgi:hypothetical protein